MSQYCSVCRTERERQEMVKGHRGEKLACPECGTALTAAKRTRTARVSTRYNN